MAWSASVVPQSTASLTRLATLVVRGIVEGQRPGYDEQANHAVLDTSIQVEESLKGRAPRSIIVRQLAHIPGDARFKEGEEVVLFLVPGTGANNTLFHLLGMGQGKFELRRAEGAPALVERDFSELTFVTRDGSAASAPGERVLTWDELRGQIRKASGARR